MKKRHVDNELYFNELDKTCRDYFIPYLQNYVAVQNLNVLEIGCGQGGNLKQFYLRGCNVVGVDINESKIKVARDIFSKIVKSNGSYNFICSNLYDMDEAEKYDVILVHDVIEHVHDKLKLILKVKNLLTTKGILFFRFPPWQMPFGGHQQICENKVCSSIPFIHLLPASWYKNLLALCGEKNSTITELLDIKKCKITIEQFELMASKELKIINRTLWFINPHYEVKFKTRPIKLNAFLSGMIFFRNFFTTSCFYLLKK